MSIDPKNFLALAKIKDEVRMTDPKTGKSKKVENVYRDAVDPGSYELDFTVRVRGLMTVAPSHQQAVAAKVPWQKICAILLGKLNGVTVESVVREAMEGNGRLTAAADEANERAQKAVRDILDGAKETVRGAVKVNFQIEEVQS